MFRRLREAKEGLTVRIDGSLVPAVEGDTVMAVLLAAGVAAFRRSAVGGGPRGPYCGMGVCFECLVTIDGETNRQACLSLVRDGMRIETGAAAPALGKGRGG